MIVKRSDIPIIIKPRAGDNLNSKVDRERLDLLRLEYRIRYIRLLEICEELVGRKIKDIGELTINETVGVYEQIKKNRR